LYDFSKRTFIFVLFGKTQKSFKKKRGSGNFHVIGSLHGRLVHFVQKRRLLSTFCTKTTFQEKGEKHGKMVMVTELNGLFFSPYHKGVVPITPFFSIKFV